MPLVSIIMPTFNQADFIGEAIQSVLKQTHQDWELIIIDNFSTDATLDVVGEFLDARIRISRFENHGIIAKSRNVAITESSGEFIAFLDSDDSWYPNKLRDCLMAFTSETSVVYHTLQVMTAASQTRVWHRKLSARRLGSNPVKDLLLKPNPISNSSAVIRKSSLVAIAPLSEEPTMTGAEDLNLWLRLASRNARFRRVNSVLGSYRIHDSNASKDGRLRAFLAATEQFLGSLSRKELRAYYANVKLLDYSLQRRVTFLQAIVGIPGVVFSKARIEFKLIAIKRAFTHLWGIK